MASLEGQRKDRQGSFDSVGQETFTLFYTRQTWRALRAVFINTLEAAAHPVAKIA